MKQTQIFENKQIEFIVFIYSYKGTVITADLEDVTECNIQEGKLHINSRAAEFDFISNVVDSIEKVEKSNDSINPFDESYIIKTVEGEVITIGLFN